MQTTSPRRKSRCLQPKQRPQNSLLLTLNTHYRTTIEIEIHYQTRITPDITLPHRPIKAFTIPSINSLRHRTPYTQ